MGLGIGLSKDRSRETIGGLRVDRLESTQLDYGKGERLDSGQLDDGREGLGSGQLDDGHLGEVTELMVESLEEKNWVVDREIMVRGRSCWVDVGN